MSAVAARKPRPGKSSAPTYQSLGGVAADAVGAMTSAILDLGKLGDTPGLNDIRVSLDAASKALHEAVRTHRGWERTVLAQATDLKLSVDLGPIAATCANCGDQALIVPEAKGPGLAICRRCSFEVRS